MGRYSAEEIYLDRKGDRSCAQGCGMVARRCEVIGFVRGLELMVGASIPPSPARLFGQSTPTVPHRAAHLARRAGSLPARVP